MLDFSTIAQELPSPSLISHKDPVSCRRIFQGRPLLRRLHQARSYAINRHYVVQASVNVTAAANPVPSRSSSPTKFSEIVLPSPVQRKRTEPSIGSPLRPESQTGRSRALSLYRNYSLARSPQRTSPRRPCQSRSNLRLAFVPRRSVGNLRSGLKSFIDGYSVILQNSNKSAENQRVESPKQKGRNAGGLPAISMCSMEPQMSPSRKQLPQRTVLRNLLLDPRRKSAVRTAGAGKRRAQENSRGSGKLS